MKETESEKKVILRIHRNKKPSSNIFNKLANLSTSKKVIASILLVGSIASLLYVLEMNGVFRSKLQLEAKYELVVPNAANRFTKLLPAEVPVRDKENPINGELLTRAEYDELMKRHPVAVTINNYTSARMQHGLSQADVVLEVLAEGGITRYVPIFYGNYDVAKIGPVRSLRYYMIEFASEYADAIILHEGQASYDNAPFETYRERADARGAIYKFRIKNIQSGASRYRDMEKARKSGYVHALYTDFQRIVPEIDRISKQWGWKLGSESLEPLKFKFDNTEADRGDFKSVTINFLSLSSKEYSSKFVYDKASNTYKRFIAEKEDIDLLTNLQIAPKNVIIEWHNYADAMDGHSRVIIDMIGEDNVIILRDGLKIEGKWKKTCRTCRTKYYDEAGKEIPLNRGQNWIVNVVKVGPRLVSKVNFEE